ncbi:MAG TPA: dihydropteroate synthase [Blastocatellia bacterium]|nr:dihydropteroate synthase [Blastocatellia bacterium]
MRKSFSLKLGNGAALELGESTIVVGVLNVTPDSFSDGGQHFDAARAIEYALLMESDGADIVEVGGESTRPGAPRLSANEELARISPVLKELGKRLRVPVAVDTYKSEVARVALDLGASIINDVSALRFDVQIAEEVARSKALLVLMHMRGEPQTMQKIEPSLDIFGEIEADFITSIREAESRGVQREQIILDPGIGFGKTLEQNLSILNHLHRFEQFGMPLMIGTSRKSFIGRLTGRPESDRVFGTAASVAVAISRGAHMIRVHDVKEMSEVVRITDAILAAR